MNKFFLLLVFHINLIFGNLLEDLHHSRQTAITKAISKVSNTVVGINVTQLKKQPIFI